MELLDQNLKVRFDELAAVWAGETACYSFKPQIIGHPAYRALLELGPDILPLVIEELRTPSRRWFYLLRALTGESPVPPEAAGDVPAMAEAWVAWYELRAVAQ